MSIYVLMSKSAYSQQIGHNTEPVRRQERERKEGKQRLWLSIRGSLGYRTYGRLFCLPYEIC